MRNLVRRSSSAIFGAIASALLVWPPASATAQDKVIAGTVGSPSANIWPQLVAIEKGFFSENRIALELIYVPSSAQLVQQLAAGSLNFITSTGLADPIRAIDKGAAVAITRIEVQSPPYVLVGKASVKTLKDLAGKTISIGGAKDITRIYVERMLAPSGIKSGQFDTVYAGATSARAQALLAGAVDAAILLPPFNFQAINAGFTDLGSTVDFAPELPFAGSAVHVPWAKASTDVVKRLNAAQSKGVDWINDPANKAEAVALLVRLSKLKQDEIEQAYEFYRKGRFFESSGKVSRKRLAALLAALEALGDIGQIEMEKLVLRDITELVE
jgi:NitT/TauT family transport system substrate-binding protein